MCSKFPNRDNWTVKSKRWDLNVKAEGDIEVDAHHTVEDVGIVLGKAFAQAMGEKRGITRFASQYLPMDETLVLAAVDISGRGQLHWDVDVPLCLLGAFDTSLAKEFFIAFATNAQVTLHVRMVVGENAHHIVEACFKAVGRAMCQAPVLGKGFCHLVRQSQFEATSGLRSRAEPLRCCDGLQGRASQLPSPIPRNSHCR